MSTFLLSLLFQLAAPAQQATTPNPSDLCTLQGVVIKAGTGEPLHKAIVEAWPAVNRRGSNDESQGGSKAIVEAWPAVNRRGSNDESQGGSKAIVEAWPAVNRRGSNDESQGGSAETDAMGRFELKGLNPGRYYLSAQRTSFVRQQYGQRTPEGQGAMLTLSAGQKVPDITFQMIPAGVITGHVYDEDGEPIEYAQVSAMRYMYVRGQRQLMGNQSGQTNDLGEFRLFGLSPGQYFVQANFQANRFGNAKTKQGYVPVYYPGVPDADRAAPITVQGGSEFSGVDISLQPVRALSVKGNVLNAGCGGTAQGAMVFLHEQNRSLEFGFQNAIRPTNAQGAFDFSNVTPGSYYLYAMLNQEGRQCFGRQALEVADSDIEGITLTVAPGVEVKGHLGVEGQSDSNAGPLTVNLIPKIMMPSGGGRSEPAKADGTFLIKNASDGDYEINVDNLPENSFVKSARLDGVDVLTAGLTVDSKQAPGSLEILVSANGADIDGSITKDQQPFQGATVAIVPDPPHRGERRLFKSTTTDQNGHFTLQGLSPGDYKVFAWEKIEAGAFTSPEFLQLYENLGESVHITEGSRNAVQVDLIPAKEQ